MLILLLTNIVNAFNHTKCVYLSNKKLIIQPTLINLHPNEYRQEFHYDALAVKLDRCFGSCNTLHDLSNKVCIPNKTRRTQNDYRNKWIKTLTRHISCECKSKFNGTKCNSNQWWSNDKCQCECKKHIWKRLCSGILLHVAVKMENTWQVFWAIQQLFVMKL